jgi:hypothetical protein
VASIVIASETKQSRKPIKSTLAWIVTPGCALLAMTIAAWSVLLYAAAFTIHGTIVSSGGILHFDVVDAYAWGREFQLGYNQHGPFRAWIAGGWFLLFPVSNAPCFRKAADSRAADHWPPARPRFPARRHAPCRRTVHVRGQRSVYFP